MYARYRIKASDLIDELQRLIDAHGDLPVFSRVDYDWVGGAAFTKGRPDGIADEDHFSLDWN